MENKIINLAIEQIETEDINKLLNNNPFFREYMEVFNENNLFNKCVIKNITSANKREIIHISKILIDKFREIINLLLRVNLENKIGLIIFIGDGSMDGHGIIVNECPYVFVDLSAIIPSISTYNLHAFMLHETIHALHYDLNKEFYPKNYVSLEDKFLKKLIVEGLATFLSMSLSDISIESAYWLGFLEHDSVQEWIYNCENMKKYIGKDLNEIIVNNQFNQDIYYKLFSILGFENLTNYRMGYYYGSQIVKIMENEKSNIEILTLKFDEVKKNIYTYFSS